MLLNKRFPQLLIVLCLFTALFSGCDKQRVYEENQTIADNTWQQSKALHFETDIKDTVSGHNMYINVRNAGGYQYSNLFLFVKTTLPKGQISIDTVECILATPEGKWLGSGLGDIYDNQILFKKNIRFLMSGKYQFEIEQAMRIDPLPMIMDVGVRIEKVK